VRLCFLRYSLVGLAGMFLLTSQVSAQTITPSGKSVQDVLQDLISEVRMLRISFIQSTAQQDRIHIELEQYRVEQDRVNTLSNRLEDVRTELAAVAEASRQLTQQVESDQRQLSVTSDLDRRATLEAAVKANQTAVEQQQHQEAQFREREGRLADALRLEEAKLEEINQRLNLVKSQLGAAGISK
jgi:hypothetical protein